MVLVMVCNRRDFLVCGCASSKKSRSTDETSSAYDTTEGRDETAREGEEGLPAAAGPFGIELKVAKPCSDKSFQYSL